MIASAITQGIGIRSIFGNAKSKADRFYSSKKSESNGAAAPGSPQANYETRRDSGAPLTEDEVVMAKQKAESMGTTFNAGTGYSRAPYAANLKQPQQSTNQEVTGFNTVQHSKFVPADVRAIQERGGARTPKEAKRMARFDSSSAGRRINGEAEPQGADRTPHVSGEGKRAPHVSTGAQPVNYRPMSKPEASKYSANLGKAWGNKLDQDDRQTGNVSAQKQADKAGVTLEARNAAVAAGAERMNKYRAKLGKPQQPTTSTAPAKVDANGLPEFEFVEGNKDGTTSRYTGASANVAEANLPKTPAPAAQPATKVPAANQERVAKLKEVFSQPNHVTDGRMTPPKPPVQADDAPVDSTGKKKKFNANLR